MIDAMQTNSPQYFPISPAKPLIALLSSMLLLSACGPASEERGPGGLVPEDASALDEAAAKLDKENAPAPPVMPREAEPQSQSQQEP